MSKIRAMTGNSAAATAALLARPGVIAAYPITPQSSVVEELAGFIASGELKSKMIQVESEHSACSVVSGASLVGERTFTATSAQGLALMYEPYFRASTLRLPIMMPIACREMTSPSSIWCGQQDAMTIRDAGWLQIYVENCQEVMDMILQGYMLAEDQDIMLPINICYDGFYLSHMVERVEIPEQEEVDAFLPPYRNKMAYLAPEDPMAVDPLTNGALMTEYRISHMLAMQNALKKLQEIDKWFGEKFGRTYGGPIEYYRMEDAKLALVTIGSMTGTAKEAVDIAREKGVKAGLIKIRMMRPFPKSLLISAISNVERWASIDRAVSFGWNCGPVYVETRAAAGSLNLYSLSFIGGLGGSDISLDAIGKAIDVLNNSAKPCGSTIWLNKDFER